MISTPELKGTILPGITRKSVIQLARLRGYEVFACRHHMHCLINFIQKCEQGLEYLQDFSNE